MELLNISWRLRSRIGSGRSMTMMRRGMLWTLIVISCVVLAGCAMAAPAPSISGLPGEDGVSLEMPPAVPEPRALEEQAVVSMGVEDVLSERMIVRTANLSLVVEDTEQTLESIEDLVTELEGYISDLRTWRVNEQMAATITLRVPAQAFEEARERTKALAKEVETENVSGQDVTEEYVDLEARLRNLERTETELLELLASAQETRQDAEQILAIYREMTMIREQIEQIQGRMQYLEDVASLATLTVNLTPEEEKPVVEPGWEPLRTVRDALRTLVNALKFLVDLLIWVVIFFLPTVALLASPLVFIWLGWFLWRRRRRRSKKS
jgi:hypothetical protein